MDTINRKTFHIMLFSLFVGICISCDDNNDDPIVDISLDRDLISLLIGGNETLTATVTPGNSSGVVWVSGNKEVATVENGVVSAVGAGRTVINARYGNNTATCDVFVSLVPIGVTGVSLNKTTLEVGIGYQEILRATIQPEEATDRRVTWDSSNPEVVSVDETGEITALSMGDAVVTVTTVDGGKTASCEVSVIPAINLLLPEENGEIKLDAADYDATVKFLWSSDVAEVTDFTLELSLTSDFATAVYSQDIPATQAAVSDYDINELVKGEAGDNVNLFWRVRPRDPEQKAYTLVRRMIVTPDRNDYLRLDETTAQGMLLDGGLPGVYRYGITTTGAAAVNTVGLTTAPGSEYVTASIMYTSNRDLAALDVSLVTAGGAVIHTLQTAVPQATQTTELTMFFTEIPSGWGQAGDYLRLDFGTDPGYEIELNAIHFREMTNDEYRLNYVPKLWKMKAVWNCEILDGGGSGQTYVSLKVIERDPVNNPGVVDPSINLSAMWAKFHPDAVMFTFEYKAETDMRNRMRVFVHGGHLSLVQNDSQCLIMTENLPRAASDWTKYEVDLSVLRERSGWGDYYAGWEIRFDPGDVPDYVFHVRNIKLELKD